MVCGMVKNSSDCGVRASILFNAFRMELTLIILYPKSVILRMMSQTGVPNGITSNFGKSSGPGVMIFTQPGHLK
jgi:hypothetical protein